MFSEFDYYKKKTTFRTNSGVHKPTNTDALLQEPDNSTISKALKEIVILQPPPTDSECTSNMSKITNRMALSSVITETEAREKK